MIIFIKKMISIINNREWSGYMVLFGEVDIQMLNEYVIN
jgi:hypothetical protein